MTHVIQQSHRLAKASRFLNKTEDGSERAADEAADRIVGENSSRVQVMPLKERLPDSLIQRQISPPADPKIQAMFTIKVDPEFGIVELRASGPEDVPVVKSPTIGVRRDLKGDWHLLVGSKDTVISISDIPSTIRGAVSMGASIGDSVLRMGLRVPSCREMQNVESGQYKSYERLKIDRSLGNEMIQISQPFYESIVEICRQQSMRERLQIPMIIPAEISESGDFPERTLPEGTEYA